MFVEYRTICSALRLNLLPLPVIVSPPKSNPLGPKADVVRCHALCPVVGCWRAMSEAGHIHYLFREMPPKPWYDPQA